MEIWKDIPRYEWLYWVSNYWFIKSYNYLQSNDARYIKLCINKHWYVVVSLSKRGICKTLYVHRVVLSTFHWYENNKEVNHKDWNKENNNLENLEWCTSSENQKHKYEVLWYKYRVKSWWKHSLSKKILQCSINWEHIKIWWWLREAWRILNISAWNISKCCKWERKNAWWYIWKYCY